MAQKLFVNQTDYLLNVSLIVRSGSTPGHPLNTVAFLLNPNEQQMVTYGDPNNPYVDQLAVSAETNGAVVLSNQVVMGKSGDLDNTLNMHDTVYISVEGQSVVISTANTWTT